MNDLPTGCFEHINHKRIIARDINHDRPCDQYGVSTERALHHDLMVEERKKFWPFRKKTYWAVLSTTTYEMAGKFHPNGRYWGGRAWAETDKTGLEWLFHTKEDAEAFAYHKKDTKVA